MNDSLFTGTLVRLAAQDPAADAQTISNWRRDTIYTRWLEVDPVLPPQLKQTRERIERPHSERFYPFAIRALADDKLIGFVILLRVNSHHRDAYVGIGIGESEYRSKGYGTDAMNLILRFAFQELNLHRVSLDAVATNARAIRSYEKCGFVHEGKTRGAEFRGGIRDDIVTMGVLRKEWERKGTGNQVDR